MMSSSFMSLSTPICPHLFSSLVSRADLLWFVQNLTLVDPQVTLDHTRYILRNVLNFPHQSSAVDKQTNMKSIIISTLLTSLWRLIRTVQAAITVPMMIVWISQYGPVGYNKSITELCNFKMTSNCKSTIEKVCKNVLITDCKIVGYTECHEDETEEKVSNDLVHQFIRSLMITSTARMSPGRNVSLCLYLWRRKLRPMTVLKIKIPSLLRLLRRGRSSQSEE